MNNTESESRVVHSSDTVTNFLYTDTQRCHQREKEKLLLQSCNNNNEQQYDNHNK